MRIVSLAIISCGALVACRGSSSKPNMPDADNSVVTIQQVQSDMMAPGTPVTIENVVVTAADNFGGRTGDLWVEEPEGGPMSGVHVFGADPTLVMSLQPGDVVTVTNCVKAAFALSSDMSGRTEVELEPPTKGAVVTVTKTGTGAVPAPSMVDALAIGKMADPDRSATWKMWDGVLVTVTNVSETTGVKQVPSSKNPDPTLQEFGITGVAIVESDLAPFPTSGLAFNACLSSVTGVVSYFFDYQILNRSAADITVAGGTSACPAPENTPALCSDGIDNDGNGFGDCMDDNCIVNDSTCRSPTSISAIDTAADANPTMPTLPAGAPDGVGITGAVITAVAADGTTFWVAGNKAAAADGGLEVYTAGQMFVASGDIGKSVDIIGKLQAYNNDSQGESLPEFDILATANLSTMNPATVTGSGCGHGTGCVASELNVAATGRPYVGSLVTLTSVKVVTANDPNNHNIGSVLQTTLCTAGTTQCTIEVEADIMPVGAANTCYTSVTGIWTYDVYNNVYALEPTVLTPGAGC